MLENENKWWVKPLSDYISKNVDSEIKEYIHWEEHELEDLDFDYIKDVLLNTSYFDITFDYDEDALDYLKENDSSFSDSLRLFKERYISIDSISPVILADLHATEAHTEDFYEYADIINDFLNILTNNTDKLLKISFDFDGVLDREDMQELCKSYIKDGADVYITTQRMLSDAWNQDVFAMAFLLGIPKENVRIIGTDSKHTHLEGFNLHFDDNEMEISDINLHTTCLGILI